MLAASEMFNRAQRFAIVNSPTILTALGVTGAVTSAFLTGKATVKATRIIDASEAEGGTAGEFKQRSKERITLVWKEYVPAVGMLALSVTCIIGANHIGSRRGAAVAAAYSLSEKAFAEYKDKVLEKMGTKDEQKVRDEIAQAHIDQRPTSREVIIVGGGNVLCFDAFSGRYFKSDVETIKKAQNDVNYNVLNNMYASLTEFYDKVGLPKTDMSDDFGWNCDRLMELELSACLTDEGDPAIHVTFRVAPISGYSRLH